MEATKGQGLELCLKGARARHATTQWLIQQHTNKDNDTQQHTSKGNDIHNK